jgi:hypothetical protein
MVFKIPVLLLMGWLLPGLFREKAQQPWKKMNRIPDDLYLISNRFVTCCAEIKKINEAQYSASIANTHLV